MVAVKIRWPSSKPATTADEQGYGGSDTAAAVAALAASTSGLAGMAVNVARDHPGASTPPSPF